MDKNIFASKTVQGLLAAALGLLLPKLHLPVGDAETQELAANILAAAGILWGLYGRSRVEGAGLRVLPAKTVSPDPAPDASAASSQPSSASGATPSTKV